MKGFISNQTIAIGMHAPSELRTWLNLQEYFKCKQHRIALYDHLWWRPKTSSGLRKTDDDDDLNSVLMFIDHTIIIREKSSKARWTADVVKVAGRC